MKQAVYFDTSALVKRYDPAEAGAARVMARLNAAPVVLSSPLTAVEVVSAFRIKERQGVFSADEVELALAAFEAQAALQYRWVAPQPSTYQEARRLILAYPLRAYDAMHLATALSVVKAAGLRPGQLEFWTGDQAQAAAAGAEGLATVLI